MTESSTVADPGRRGLPELSADLPRLRPAEEGGRGGEAAREWRLRLPEGRTLVLGRVALVMGIVNVTPDSFSDGGLHLDPERALEHALRLLAEGADLVDLGAESTRPGGGVYGAGACATTVDEELGRLLPVLRRLRRQTSAVLSIDTRKAAVARAALEEGADLINDVSALGDGDMAALVASRDVPIVLMHSRGAIPSMQHGIRFSDLVTEVCRELRAKLETATGAGIAADQTVLDPGIGFGKTAAQNLELLARLDVLGELGRPLLVGASRKSFIGALTADPPADRLEGSLAAAAWARHCGAGIVRVHDVAPTVKFLRVWEAIEAARSDARNGA